MQMLQSNSLTHHKRSAINVRWFDLIDKLATFPRFFVLSESFKEHLETQMRDQILEKILKIRRSLLLAFKNSKC